MAKLAKKTIPSEDELRAFTIAEVCERVSIGRTKLYEEIREERLQTRKVGSRTLITAGALHAWLYRASNDNEAPQTRMTGEEAI